MSTLIEIQSAGAPAATSIEGVAASSSPAPVAGEATPKPGEAAPAKEEQRAIDRIASLSADKRKLGEEVKALSGRLVEAEQKAKDAVAYRDLRERAQKDPKGVARELGLTFEQLVDAFAGVDTEKVVNNAAADLDKIKAEIEARFAEQDRREKDKEKAELDARIGNTTKAAITGIGEQIKKDPDRWEVLCREPKAAEEAFNASQHVLGEMIKAGQSFDDPFIDKLLVDILDEMEKELVQRGERYRRTKPLQGGASSNGSKTAGTAGSSASQSGQRAPTTIDPDVVQGGLLMRAQAKANGDNSSEAVRQRIKAALGAR